MLTDVIGRVDTIADVVAAMRAIDAALPANDGVKWFNYLYLRVTEAVQADVDGWQDRPFLQRFDVVFAKLYFDALAAWEKSLQLDPAADAVKKKVEDAKSRRVTGDRSKASQ